MAELVTAPQIGLADHLAPELTPARRPKAHMMSQRLVFVSARPGGRWAALTLAGPYRPLA